MKYETKFKLGQKVWCLKEYVDSFLFYPCLPEEKCDENNKTQQRELIANTKVRSITLTKQRGRTKATYNRTYFLCCTGLEESVLYGSEEECLKDNLKLIKKTLKERRLAQEKARKERLKKHAEEHKELFNEDSK